MNMDRHGKQGDSLHVFLMALALIVAAFTGAALGLAWKNFGPSSGEPEQSEQAADAITDSAEEAAP